MCIATFPKECFPSRETFTGGADLDGLEPVRHADCQTLAGELIDAEASVVRREDRQERIENKPPGAGFVRLVPRVENQEGKLHGHAADRT